MTMRHKKTVVPQETLPVSDSPPLLDGSGLSKKQRSIIHWRIGQMLAQNEEECEEMEQAALEVRLVADPELGIPRPKAWAAIVRKHPLLRLPKEPNLTLTQQDELADKLRQSGRLKRVRSTYWNPWAAQDEARNQKIYEMRRTLDRAYSGLLPVDDWKVFRRKHRNWHLPLEPKLTLKQWMDALDKVPLYGWPAHQDRSLYSAIRWSKKK